MTEPSSSPAKKILAAAAAKTAGGKRPKRDAVIFRRVDSDEGVGILSVVTGSYLVHALGEVGAAQAAESEAEIWASDPAGLLASKGLRPTAVPLSGLDALEWDSGGDTLSVWWHADGEKPRSQRNGLLLPAGEKTIEKIALASAIARGGSGSVAESREATAWERYGMAAIFAAIPTLMGILLYVASDLPDDPNAGPRVGRKNALAGLAETLGFWSIPIGLAAGAILGFLLMPKGSAGASKHAIRWE